jgi:hypothetical protein
LYTFLSDFRLTEHAAEYFKEALNFELDTSLAQDKLVELGRALSRIISLQLILNLGERGFNQKLIGSAIETLRSDVQRMLGSFNQPNDAEVIEDYEESSSWFHLFSPVLA